MDGATQGQRDGSGSKCEVVDGVEKKGNVSCFPSGTETITCHINRSIVHEEQIDKNMKNRNINLVIQ